MILGLITYTRTFHDIPEGPVGDFLTSEFMQDYCAGNFYPLIINPISAESVQDMFDGDAEGYFTERTTAEQRQAVVEWLRSIAPDEETIVAILEG